MSNSKTLVLHLGIHKTGSSAIQSSLAKYRNQLKSVGLHVFDCLPENHSEFFQCSFGDDPTSYHSVRDKKMSLNQVKVRSAFVINKLRQELSESSSKIFVLTGEDGSLLSVDGLSRLAEFLANLGFQSSSVKIIIYAREHSAYVASAIQQNVKANNLTIQRSFSWHFRSSSCLYANLYIRLATVFPSSSIHFYDFQKACQHEGGLFGHFLETINIELSDFAEIRENIGLSLESIYLIDLARRNGLTLTRNQINALGKIHGFGKFDLGNHAKVAVRNACLNDRNFLRNVCGIEFLPFNDRPLAPPSTKKYLCALKESNPLLFSKLLSLWSHLLEGEPANFHSLSDQDMNELFIPSLTLSTDEKSVKVGLISDQDHRHAHIVSRLRYMKDILSGCRSAADA